MDKHNRIQDITAEGGSISAFIPRTMALCIILVQFRIIAADLADTPVFMAALLGALACALVLFFRNVKPLAALLIMALVPWAIRLFIALPRWFVSNSTALVFDSLLLNFDRNNFVSLLPFYWAAVSSYFSLRSREFLRMDIVAGDVFFLILFSIVSASSLEAYRWPILMIALFALIFFLQILGLILSLPKEFRIKRNEKLMAAAAALALVILGSLLFIRPSQERAVERGGGLLEPKLFRFDFSQFLKLDTEISINDDLVLIVRKDSEDMHILLRRYTLSGYSPKQGFYRMERIDEKAHPQKLPETRTKIPDQEEIILYRETSQEYYLVNLDSSAFIGMNMPVEIIPYETWDTSSFSSAYGVISHTSEAYPFELLDAAGASFSGENPGLTEDEYKLYTDYGGDSGYLDLAREITRGLDNYWEQAEAVYEWLKYGEYRYSLKPGIAPDGDQLKYFLFESKKGYCSYYAFSFAVLLRSLGIPCRVAAGFFIDPGTNVFNYYPVRANMAHAWVEVWYPRYGWIEYDPTSEQLAEGEEFLFGPDEPPELFERLIKEILDNHSLLKAREGEGTKNLTSPGQEAIRFLKNQGLVLCIIIILLLFVIHRAGLLWISYLKRNPRRKARFLWAHCKRRLSLGAIEVQKKTKGKGEAEWAAACPLGSIYVLYLDSAAARFAPLYSKEDFGKMKEHYDSFNREYGRAVSPARRFLAWGPLSLIKKTGKHKALLFLVLIFSLLIRGTNAQTDFPSPEDLYTEARRAQENENWERAMELYTLGSRLYPRELGFPWAAGNLYFQRRLFRLAWDEYSRAEKIAPLNTDVLYQLARTAGYLNMDLLSVKYLERLLQLDPDNREAIGNLGWMYYKVHRLIEGELLLLSAMDRMGEDADLAMTLGTIYSDLFNYGEARKWYLKSIAEVESAGDRLFAAVAHYNLSILESRFYKYENAYDRTNLSLNAMNRASGRLARGELLARRMELSRAFNEYQEAYEMDSSPLSKLNLAQVFQIGGKLREARLYAEDCLKAGDHSWMLNYGIDPVRYYRDIHEILKDIYKGLEKAEAFNCPASMAESFKKPFRVLGFRFRGTVHELLFRKYCLLSARAYGSMNRNGSVDYTEEINLEALIQYYNAFEQYPRRAINYLRRARSCEEPRIPESVPNYILEEGILLKKQNLIRRALESLDPYWEKDLTAKAYTELAKKGSASREAGETLYSLNPGALRQAGIRLDAELQLIGFNSRTEGAIKKAVQSAGIRPVNSGNRKKPRYTLIITGEETSVYAELKDGDRILRRQNFNLPSTSLKDRAVFSQDLGEALFNGL